MSWEDILKRIEVLPESKVEDMAKDQNLKWQSSKEKGYPVSNLTMVVDIDDDTDDLKGYTSFKDMGKFYFVGNSYSYQKGSFGKVLPHRNNKVVPKNAPKITLVNPIEGSTKEGLMRMVARGGGIEIKDYSMVDDIMSEQEYERLTANPNITMARYPPHKLMKWEEVLKNKKLSASRKRAGKKTKKRVGNKKSKKKASPYANPRLRAKVVQEAKNKVFGDGVGGNARGAWSGRKAQWAAREYKKRGGKYK